MSTDNFLVSENELLLGASRKKKEELLRKAGDPISGFGKALGIDIRGKHAWIADNTTYVRKLDLETGKSAQIYKGHTAPVTAIAFCDRVPGSGDQEILISGSWDKSIRLWDTKTKQEISTTANAHTDFVKSLLVIPSCNLLISGSSDKIVRFWDLSNPASAEPLKSAGSISSHTRPVECLDGLGLSATSGILWTGDTMGVMKHWELSKDEGAPARWRANLKDTINDHRTRINELYYKNGQLWTASADESVRVRLDKDTELSKGRPPVPIIHPLSVRAILPLQLTELGEPYLITGCGDVLRTYDVSSLDEPELVKEMDAHWHDITAIRLWMRQSVGEDGKTRVEPWVVTTSLDGTIRKWRLAELLQPGRFLVDVAAPLKQPEPPKSASELTEEEEKELAEMMGDD